MFLWPAQGRARQASGSLGVQRRLHTPALPCPGGCRQPGPSRSAALACLSLPFNTSRVTCHMSALMRFDRAPLPPSLFVKCLSHVTVLTGGSVTRFLPPRLGDGQDKAGLSPREVTSSSCEEHVPSFSRGRGLDHACTRHRDTSLEGRLLVGRDLYDGGRGVYMCVR